MAGRLLPILAALALAIAGCGGDESDEEAERVSDEAAAVDYALGVEASINAVYSDGSRAIATLNRLADRKADPIAGARTLDEVAMEVEDSLAELEQLDPPPAAEDSGEDMNGKVGDLARDLQSAAIDIRAAERGLISLPETARAHAKIVLVQISGLASLSRAIRSLAIESGGS